MSRKLVLPLPAAAIVALGVLVSVSGANHATMQLVSTTAAGGNGAFSASFAGASSDSSRVFFGTHERLEAGDTDTSQDVYERVGSTTTRLSTGPTGGNGAFDAGFEGASTDGSRVFFTTNEPLEAGDTDTQPDVYQRSGSSTTRISTGPSGGNGAFSASFAGASMDGSRVFFTTNEPLEAGDTDTQADVYERSGSTTTRISTGPSGGNGAFSASFARASVDGSRVFFTTSEQLEAGDTDIMADIYERSGSSTTRISTGSGGGNGTFGVIFRSASADGSRVLFTTVEQLEAGDTDSHVDIYERSGSTTTWISTGPAGGNGAHAVFLAGISTDGSRVFFETNEQLEAGDTDTQGDVYERFGSTTTRISTGSSGGNGTGNAFFRGVSTDGSRVLFTTIEPLEAGDTDGSTDIYERSGTTTTRISTGPSGGNGGSIPTVAGASADGSRVFFTTIEPLEAGDTDTAQDIYERSGSTTTRISAGPAGGNGAFGASFAGASADGTRVFVHTSEPFSAADTDTEQDVYAAGLASTAGYPRPVGATPLRVAFVPVYEECTDPNVGHTGPFAFEACNPPKLASNHLTVGTPDANGAPAKSLGFLRIGSIVGRPGGDDDADASLEMSILDVRNQGTLSDYTRELRVSSELRITDRANGADGKLPGTVVDLPLNVTVPCSATGDTTIGGSCAITTSFDTLFGASAVVEGKRAIFKLERVDVFDGGADGDVNTPGGDTVFASQGFFVP